MTVEQGERLWPVLGTNLSALVADPGSIFYDALVDESMPKRLSVTGEAIKVVQLLAKQLGIIDRVRTELLSQAWDDHWLSVAGGLPPGWGKKGEMQEIWRDLQGVAQALVPLEAKFLAGKWQPPVGRTIMPEDPEPEGATRINARVDLVEMEHDHSMCSLTDIQAPEAVYLTFCDGAIALNHSPTDNVLAVVDKVVVASNGTVLRPEFYYTTDPFTRYQLRMWKVMQRVMSIGEFRLGNPDRVLLWPLRWKNFADKQALYQRIAEVRERDGVDSV